MSFVRRAETSKETPQTATVVLVGFLKQEEDFLQNLLDRAAWPMAHDCTWSTLSKPSVAATLIAVHHDRIPIVLCDRDLQPEVWKELLTEFGCLPEPPCLIVTSRLADDFLWAEALNLGAYDVLARPFDTAEVVRSIGLAHLHWANRRRPQRVMAARSVA